MDPDKNYFMLSEGVYDFLKKVVQIVLPAFSTLYLMLDGIWGLPQEGKVVGTVAALTTFLGVILGISSRQYNNSDAAFDGDALVSTNEIGKTIVSLDLNKEPKKILGKKDIRLKIKEE